MPSRTIRWPEARQPEDWPEAPQLPSLQYENSITPYLHPVSLPSNSPSPSLAINSLIRCSSPKCLNFDLSVSSKHIISFFSGIYLNDPACVPPIDKVEVLVRYKDGKEQTLDISRKQGDPHQLTIGRVLGDVHAFLRKNAQNQSSSRAKETFKKRIGGLLSDTQQVKEELRREKEMGVRNVDLLAGYTCFAGFSVLEDGKWELHLEPCERYFNVNQEEAPIKAQSVVEEEVLMNVQSVGEEAPIKAESVGGEEALIYVQSVDQEEVPIKAQSVGVEEHGQTAAHLEEHISQLTGASSAESPAFSVRDIDKKIFSMSVVLCSSWDSFCAQLINRQSPAAEFIGKQQLIVRVDSQELTPKNWVTEISQISHRIATDSEPLLELFIAVDACCNKLEGETDIEYICRHCDKLCEPQAQSSCCPAFGSDSNALSKRCRHCYRRIIEVEEVEKPKDVVYQAPVTASANETGSCYLMEPSAIELQSFHSDAQATPMAISTEIPTEDLKPLRLSPSIVLTNENSVLRRRRRPADNPPEPTSTGHDQDDDKKHVAPPAHGPGNSPIWYYVCVVGIFLVTLRLGHRRGSNWERRHMQNALSSSQDWVIAANIAIVALVLAALAISNVLSTLFASTFVVAGGIYAFFAALYSGHIKYRVGGIDWNREKSRLETLILEGCKCRNDPSSLGLCILLTLPFVWMAWSSLHLLCAILAFSIENSIGQVENINSYNRTDSILQTTSSNGQITNASLTALFVSVVFSRSTVVFILTKSLVCLVKLYQDIRDL